MDELLEMFRSSILKFVRKYSIVIPSPLSNNDAGEHERTWRSKFLKASEEWATVGYPILMCLYIVQLANDSQWYHSTHTAFCRHYGSYKSGSIGYRSWNDDLAAALKEDLQPQWDTVQDWLDKQKAPFSTRNSDTFKEAYDLLRRHERTAPRAIRNILSTMASREKNILHDMDTCIQNLLQATQYV